MLLLCLLCGRPSRAESVGLLMTGGGCPDPAVSTALTGALRARRMAPLPAAATAAAVAAVRAARALGEARRLYMQTNFAGCISLLLITEQELGLNLAAPGEGALQRGHRLLAEVNLWLGVCQWAAGDPQAAAASFVRSAQLPSSPAPDSTLLPPDVLGEYSKAVAAPREEVSCELDAALDAGDLLVDGKGPTVKGRTLRVAEGTHYLVMHLRCADEDPGCTPSRRSLRLNGQARGCRVARPAVAAQPRTPVVCVSTSEAADPAFGGEVAARGGASGMLVTALLREGVALRLAAPGKADFVRQFVSSATVGHESLATLVSRSAGMVFGEGPAPARSEPPPGPQAWYQRWWVWGIVGVTVAGAAIAAIAASSQSDRVNVVFRR